MDNTVRFKPGVHYLGWRRRNTLKMLYSVFLEQQAAKNSAAWQGAFSDRDHYRWIG